nr:DUF4007 family protein [Thalassobacillus sp. C254]
MKTKKVSSNSIKRDIDCLIKCYTAAEAQDPEDIMVSPFSALKLIEINDGIITKLEAKYENIGDTALLYILLIIVKKMMLTHLQFQS